MKTIARRADLSVWFETWWQMVRNNNTSSKKNNNYSLLSMWPTYLFQSS